MTALERRRLVEAVRSWAQDHPHPDRPVLSTLRFQLSPREIGEDSEAGRWLLTFFELGANTLGIDGVIRDLEGPRVFL